MARVSGDIELSLNRWATVSICMPLLSKTPEALVTAMLEVNLIDITEFKAS